jgi:two-component system KDP operon response regulator KdpE
LWGRRLLLADADRSLRGVLDHVLGAYGYQVDVAADRRAALALAARHHPDLIILDLSLPGVVGMVPKLRARDTTPILLLSAWGTEPDRQAALDAGADDYLTKPFRISELLVRVRAALRRATASAGHGAITTEHFTVDLAHRQVRTPAGEVRLTPTEWQLVEVLVRNQGRPVTTRRLLQEIWGSPSNDQTNHHLSVNLARIRRKLEPDPARPRYFHTEPGAGVRFQAGQPPGHPQQPYHAAVGRVPAEDQ